MHHSHAGDRMVGVDAQLRWSGVSVVSRSLRARHGLHPGAATALRVGRRTEAIQVVHGQGHSSQRCSHTWGRGAQSLRGQRLRKRSSN